MANNREYRDDIYLNDTNFAFSRNVNFAGVSTRNLGTRGASFILTDEQYAWFREQGYNAKEYNGQFSVSAKLRYKDPGDPNKGRYDPKVYLVTDPNQNPQLLDEDCLETIDNLAAEGMVKNLCVRIHPGYVDTPQFHGWVLYISEIYVEQDLNADQFHSRYFHANACAPVEENEPF